MPAWQSLDFNLSLLSLFLSVLEDFWLQEGNTSGESGGNAHSWNQSLFFEGGLLHGVLVWGTPDLCSGIRNL